MGTNEHFHSFGNYIFPREIELKFVNGIGFETYFEKLHW